MSSSMGRSLAESRRAVLGLAQRLKRCFAGRDEAVDLAILALVSGEPLLFIGPPGTAKSDLAVKLAEALGLGPGDYFEYLVTAFTEPSEILGPVDITALREQGIYRRCLDGKLADSVIVFLDEIFHGNSAILNTLLTAMNERKVYDAGRPVRLDRLVGLFAATNEIPERPELAALLDRFVLKVELEPVAATRFDELVMAGTRSELQRESSERPWSLPGEVGIGDLLRIRGSASELLRAALPEPGDEPRPMLPAAVHRLLRQIVAELWSRGVALSDRQVVKVHRLAVVHALLFGGRGPSAVVPSDLSVLRHVGASPEARRTARECVDLAIGAVE